MLHNNVGHAPTEEYIASETMAEHGRRFFRNYLIKDYGYLKLFFIILCSYFIIQELYVFFFVKPTITRSVKSKMNNDDFPEILLCPEPSYDPEAVEKHGYWDFFLYVTGRDFAWNGMNESDIKEVYENISVLKSQDDCPIEEFGFILFKPAGSKEVASLEDGFGGLDFKLTKALYPFHTCCQFVKTNLTDTDIIYGVQIALSNDVNYTYSQFRIIMADQFAFSTFRQHEANTLGDIIALPLEPLMGFNNYIVKINQDHHLENDPNYPCIDYKKPGDYDKCLEEEYLSRIRKYVNCTPPWFTENEDLWCKNGINFRTESDQKKFVKILEKIVLARADTGKCSGRNCKSINPSNSCCLQSF